MTARETPAGERMARQSRQAERGGAGRIPGRRERGPAGLPRCIRLALRRPDLVPVGRRRLLHHPARPLGVGQVHGRRWSRLDLDRLATTLRTSRVQSQGDGRADRGAERRWPLGRDRQRDVASLPRRKRPEVPRAHAQRAALALLRQAEEGLLPGKAPTGLAATSTANGERRRPAPCQPSGDRATILPWGAVVRGYRWGRSSDVALLLHEPGADLDAWGPLPVEIARQLEIETVARRSPRPWSVRRSLGTRAAARSAASAARNRTGGRTPVPHRGGRLGDRCPRARSRDRAVGPGLSLAADPE